VVSPAEARAQFRGGLVTPTAGWCPGWTQANLIAVPRALAWDFLLFAQRNPKPCPVLDVLEPGAAAGPLLAGDIRTDVPLYRVYVDGELVAETTDVTEWWADDVVGFLIGCSFTFERALGAAGVPVRHVEQGVNLDETGLRPSRPELRRVDEWFVGHQPHRRGSCPTS
jgi:uncharacterized protein YcsI (UPF0317 family)